MKAIRIEIKDESVASKLRAYTEGLPRAVVLSSFYGKLLEWYLEQPKEFQERFEVAPEKRHPNTYKGGRKAGSKDSAPRTRGRKVGDTND